jgi:hypothetical protein
VTVTHDKWRSKLGKRLRMTEACTLDSDRELGRAAMRAAGPGDRVLGAPTFIPGVATFIPGVAISARPQRNGSKAQAHVRGGGRSIEACDVFIRSP